MAIRKLQIVVAALGMAAVLLGVPTEGKACCFFDWLCGRRPACAPACAPAYAPACAPCAAPACGPCAAAPACGPCATPTTAYMPVVYQRTFYRPAWTYQPALLPYSSYRVAYAPTYVPACGTSCYSPCGSACGTSCGSPCSTGCSSCSSGCSSCTASYGPVSTGCESCSTGLTSGGTMASDSPAVYDPSVQPAPAAPANNGNGSGTGGTYPATQQPKLEPGFRAPEALPGAGPPSAPPVPPAPAAPGKNAQYDRGVPLPTVRGADDRMTARPVYNAGYFQLIASPPAQTPVHEAAAEKLDDSGWHASQD